MIPGAQGRSGSGSPVAYLAAYDRPGKPRTYVRRVDLVWHSWTVDPREAHHFADAETARRLLEQWLGRGNANRLGVTVIALDEIRAHNRRAARKAQR